MESATGVRLHNPEINEEDIVTDEDVCSMCFQPFEGMIVQTADFGNICFKCQKKLRRQIALQQSQVMPYGPYAGRVR